MKAAAKRRRPSASLSASEFAQMGVCERLTDEELGRAAPTQPTSYE